MSTRRPRTGAITGGLQHTLAELLQKILNGFSRQAGTLRHNAPEAKGPAAAPSPNTRCGFATGNDKTLSGKP